MPPPASHFYDFGPFRLDPAQRVLLQDGGRVTLPPKVFETLRVLVENHGRIVEKDELMKRVWPDTFVEEGNLTVNIFLLRKVLGKVPSGISPIETIPRRGYCFVAPVEIVPVEPAGPALASGSLGAEAGSDGALKGRSESGRPNEPGDGREIGRRGDAATDTTTRDGNGQPAVGAAVAPIGPGLAPLPPETDLPSEGPSQTLSRRDDRPLPGGRPGRTSRTMLVAPTLALIVLTGILAWFLARPSSRPKMINVFRLTDFGLADAFDNLLADGTRLYFVEVKGGHRGLMQVPLVGGEPAPIPTPFPGVTLFGISPDRSELLVGNVVGNEDEVPLWSLPLVSGSPRRLGNFIAHDAAWSPDGQKLVYAHGSEIYMSKSDGSQPRKVAALSGEAWWLRWSPDSRLIRFTLKESHFGGFSLWEIHADGTQLRPLLPGWRPAGNWWGLGESAGVWTPDGRYYLFRSRHNTESIWTTRESGLRFRAAGRQPVQLYEGPVTLDFYTLVPSLDGRRLFFIGQEERRQLARYDARIQQFVPYLPDIPAQFPGPFCFSRDGQWVAYVSSGVLYRSRTDGTGRFQLTASPIGVDSACFSPDGQRIAYQAHRAGEPSKIFIVSNQGGEPDQITAGPDQDELADWSADGKMVLLQREAPGAGGERGAYLFDVKSRQMSELPGSENAESFRWSPDGRYVIAARSSGSNLHAIGLFDFQAGAWRQLTQPMTFRNLFWSRDSKYVYGQDLVGERRVFRVRVSDGRLEWVTSPNLLLPVDVAAWGFAGLARDGSPLGVLLRKNSDIYALDLDLP